MKDVFPRMNCLYDELFPAMMRRMLLCLERRNEGGDNSGDGVFYGFWACISMIISIIFSLLSMMNYYAYENIAVSI